MKRIVIMSLVVAGVLLINACDDEESLLSSPSVAQGTSFLNTDYDLVYFGPSSLGVIDLADTRTFNVGEKLKITGTISFRGPRDRSYTVKQYEGIWEIHHVSKHSINVGNDFAGIAYNGGSGERIHVEFNQGSIVLLENN